MVILLLVCLQGDCPTLYFRTSDRLCPGCGLEGTPIAWALKPPKPRS